MCSGQDKGVHHCHEQLEGDTWTVHGYVPEPTCEGGWENNISGA